MSCASASALRLRRVGCQELRLGGSFCRGSQTGSEGAAAWWRQRGRGGRIRAVARAVVVGEKRLEERGGAWSERALDARRGLPFSEPALFSRVCWSARNGAARVKNRLNGARTLFCAAVGDALTIFTQLLDSCRGIEHNLCRRKKTRRD